MFVRWCNVHVDPRSDTAVVVACSNHESLSAEIPDQARLVDAANEAESGAAVLEALEACQFEPSFDYFGAKDSDWPAYQISGERTIRSFEENWIGLQRPGGE